MFGWFDNYDDGCGEIVNFVPGKRMVVSMNNGDIKTGIVGLNMQEEWDKSFKSAVIERWNRMLIG